MTSLELTQLHKVYKETALFGRYITNKMIASIVEKFSSNFNIDTIGYSVENRPIYAIKIGTGITKVLLWSQMHGNESTTTKAIFDVLNVFYESDFLDDILKSCSLVFIPILNPDGAHAYTRLNANQVDLNRDAQDLSQSESMVLRTCFHIVKPDFCFNLHGQRTIFGAGVNGKPATLSFLAPAEDELCKVTETRQKAMAIILEVYNQLNDELPNAIGRYDDGYNINCVGDTFQSLKVPTILFEAGHHPNDYDREITRLFMFKAIVLALTEVAETNKSIDFKQYFKIPENEKNYYDVIIRNAKLQQNDRNVIDIAIQFKEVLIEDTVVFNPIVEKIEVLHNYFGHKEVDAKGAVVLDHLNMRLKVSNEIDFVKLNNSKILLKS